MNINNKSDSLLVSHLVRQLFSETAKYSIDNLVNRDNLVNVQESERVHTVRIGQYLAGGREY